MLDEEDWGLEVNQPFKSFAGDTSVYCKKCHKRFYHPQNFLHHLHDKHGEIQLYCNVCYEYKNKKHFFSLKMYIKSMLLYGIHCIRCL